MDENEDKLLNATDLAKELGTNKVKIHRLKANGYLCYFPDTKLFRVGDGRRALQLQKDVLDKKMITAKEAAEILGVSGATVSKKAKAGELNPIKTDNKNVFFLVKDVKDLKQQRAGAKQATTLPENDIEQTNQDEDEMLALKKQGQINKNRISAVKAAEAEGKVISVDIVAHQRTELLKQLKQLPDIATQRIMTKIRECNDPKIMESMIKNELIHFLKSINWGFSANER